MEGVEIKEGYELRKVAKSQRMQLLVRPCTAQKLKEIAQENDISVNELANRLFESLIEANVS